MQFLLLFLLLGGLIGAIFGGRFAADQPILTWQANIGDGFLFPCFHFYSSSWRVVPSAISQHRSQRRPREQLNRESDAMPVAFGAMLVECVLAMLAVAAA